MLNKSFKHILKYFNSISATNFLVAGSLFLGKWLFTEALISMNSTNAYETPYLMYCL